MNGGATERGVRLCCWRKELSRPSQREEKNSCWTSSPWSRTTGWRASRSPRSPSTNTCQPRCWRSAGGLHRRLRSRCQHRHSTFPPLMPRLGTAWGAVAKTTMLCRFQSQGLITGRAEKRWGVVKTWGGRGGGSRWRGRSSWGRWWGSGRGWQSRGKARILQLIFATIFAGKGNYVCSKMLFTVMTVNLMAIHCLENSGEWVRDILGSIWHFDRQTWLLLSFDETNSWRSPSWSDNGSFAICGQILEILFNVQTKNYLQSNKRLQWSELNGPWLKISCYTVICPLWLVCVGN